MTRVLPEIHTLAALDPHTLLMELNHESKKTLEDSLSNKTDSHASELYAHELQHFQDVIGTVWGQDYLDLLFSAYDAVLMTPAEESIFPKLLALFDADRSILFPAYYKYVMPNAPHGSKDDRWEMTFSSGAKIMPDGRTDESSPILFVRFDKGPKHVARQPITVGSLLEMRAIGAETGAFRKWNNTRTEGTKLINESLRSKEMLKFLYDPSMTTYSVASHVAGYVLKKSDAISMTDAAFKISDIALNLTNNEFGRLQHPAGFFKELSRERLRGFVSQRNRGYAYTVILLNLPEMGKDLITEQEIEMALRKSGLRNIDSIIDSAATSVLRKKRNNLRNPVLKEIRSRLVDAGLLIMHRRNYDHFSLSPPLPFTPTPLVMTEDLEEFHIGPPAISQEQTHFLHHCYDELRLKTRLALRASRGFEFGWTDFVY